MDFYQIVTIIKQLDEDEFGTTDLVLLNGVHGNTAKYGIAEPGGYYTISDSHAQQLVERD